MTAHDFRERLEVKPQREDADSVQLVRLGRVAYDCERDLRLIRMESAQSREISPRCAWMP